MLTIQLKKINRDLKVLKNENILIQFTRKKYASFCSDLFYLGYNFMQRPKHRFTSS